MVFERRVARKEDFKNIATVQSDFTTSVASFASGLWKVVSTIWASAAVLDCDRDNRRIETLKHLVGGDEAGHKAQAHGLGLRHGLRRQQRRADVIAGCYERKRGIVYNRVRCCEAQGSRCYAAPSKRAVWLSPRLSQAAGRHSICSDRPRVQVHLEEHVTMTFPSKA